MLQYHLLALWTLRVAHSVALLTEINHTRFLHVFIKAPGVPEPWGLEYLHESNQLAPFISLGLKKSTNSSYFRFVRWVRQVLASGGDPGGVCGEPCTCCLSSLTHRGADSQNARGQLLTGTASDSPLCIYLPPLHGASKGQLLRACKDVSGGAGGQGVGGATVMGGLHAFSRRWASRFYNYTPR